MKVKLSHQIRNKASRVQLIMFNELLNKKKSEYDSGEEAYHAVRSEWMSITNNELPAHYSYFRTLMNEALKRRMRDLRLLEND